MYMCVLPSTTRRPVASGTGSFDVTITSLIEWSAWTTRDTMTDLTSGRAFADQTVGREFALKVDAECTICHETCNDAFVTCGYCMNQLHAKCLTDYKATAGDSSKKCPTCRNVVF